ncbi:ThuA domain-containing protein [Halosimplex sp. J119]
MARIEALLIGENSIHDFDAKAPLIESALGEEVDVDRTTDPAALADLGEYDILVDYVTDSRPVEANVEALRSFVRDGGGYLPLHCASDLTNYVDEDGEFQSRDEPLPELRQLIGGHFLDHPEQSTFAVEIVDSDHPVTDSVSDFEVFDEPYQVDYDRDLTVLARMDHPDLDDAYPVLWVREVGEGRVCYSSLGHSDEALRNESHCRVLRNAVEWLA